MRDGLALAIALEVKKLIVELDSKVLFDLVWGDAKTNAKLNPLIFYCRTIYWAFKEILM